MPKFKLLLNENIGIKTTEFLQSRGYDVKSAIEDFRGFSDKQILAEAIKEERIVVSLDTDFCALIFRDSLPCRGVILLRLKNESSVSINKVLKSFLKDVKDDLAGKFVVISESKIRMKTIKQVTNKETN